MALITTKKDKHPLGIYVHIPFCRSRCQYCDFYSTTCKEDKLIDGYMKAVCSHIEETGPLAPNHIVDTIYFGGGTPSFFGAEGLATILTAIRRNFDVAGDAEITFEANPDSVSDNLLRRLRAEGFNRVSLGIQSDDDVILEQLGRPHDYAQAVTAFQRIRKAGFDNVSVDLMFGLPNQTMNTWMQTLENVLTLKPDHISCYMLRLEEGTPMYDIRNFLRIPDDDMQADMYLQTVEVLKKYGFRQYEISNFARKSKLSKHNMKYWTGGEWIGFGPSASSDFAGKRYVCVPDLKKYVTAIRNKGQVISDISELPIRERAGDYLMLRLRTTTGIAREEYERQYLLPFDPLEEVLRRYQETGHVRFTNERWRLTPEGFLISSAIISDLLLEQDKSEPLAKRRFSH
ncbi:MAG: radical SAM family heme chaperone HemW [Oscillospiraceae bacterium]|nr:radical SAM family heme chaperone HemW [Oscillospiraceae bacterium]